LARSFPRRSKDAGQGSIGLAAVGLGIWLGHWPHVSHSSAMHQSSGRSRTSVRTLSAHARLCDTSNARGNEKEPKFPGGRASISEPQNFRPVARRRRHQSGVRMCNLRNRVRTARGAVGALQPVVQYAFNPEWKRYTQNKISHYG
jgi:hypothetical protein